MKNFKTLLAALGICTFGAQAQDVIVVLNDGTTHQWAADEVKEIVFGEAKETINVTFTRVTAYSWNPDELNIRFYNADETYKMNLYLYAPGVTTKNIPSGTYRPSDDPSTTEYCFSSNPLNSCVFKNNNPIGIIDGILTVSSEGDTYTMTMDMTLEDGSVIKGKYVGKL